MSTEELTLRAARLKLGLQELRDACAKILTSEHPSCDTLTIIIEGMNLVERSLHGEAPNGGNLRETRARRGGGSSLN